MNYGMKWFLCLIVMGLGFAYFLFSVVHRQFLWAGATVLVVVFCVRMFLRMESKDKRKIHEMIASKQTFEAVIDAWGQNETEARGKQFFLLLSFSINGMSHQKGYEINWDQNKAGLATYIDKHPVGSSITLIYSPEDLSVLAMDDNHHLLSEISDFTFKRVFNATSTEN